MKKLPQVSPLALNRRSEPFDHPDWIFELKQDGFRGVAYVTDRRCRLVSRNRNVFKRFAPLTYALAKLPVKNAILDGEIVCLDVEGKSHFNELVFERGVQYLYAFDLLWLDGRDLRGLPLIERKECLKELILAADNYALLYADHVDEHGTDFFRMVCEKDLEGIVAKHRTSTYTASARWTKIKNPSYTQSRGRHKLFDKT